MSGEHVYLYALTLAANPCRGAGAGIDPRFPVERICLGQLAAISSRVGWDQFDVNRFRGENPQDAQWLSRVAVRHNEIVAAACKCPPVMPLRLGTLFCSRSSMVAKMHDRRSAITELLLRLGKRQEWAAKLYASRPPAHGAPARPEPAALPAGSAENEGADYLRRKRTEYRRRSESRSALPGEVLSLENALKERADECRRVQALPAHVTGRREDMLWNAAFLISPARAGCWLSLAERLGRAVRSKGLLLEISGPWPPYHFCGPLPF